MMDRLLSNYSTIIHYTFYSLLIKRKKAISYLRKLKENLKFVKENKNETKFPNNKIK